MKKKKVYSGWIDPSDWSQLPDKVQTYGTIQFFRTKLRSNSFPCTITVEWTEANKGKK